MRSSVHMEAVRTRTAAVADEAVAESLTTSGISDVTGMEGTRVPAHCSPSRATCVPDRFPVAIKRTERVCNRARPCRNADRDRLRRGSEMHRSLYVYR